MTGSPLIEPSGLPARVEGLPGIETLHEIAAQVPAYLVGGAVRDLLLGIQGSDLDVAIEGDPEVLGGLTGFQLEREGLFLTGRLKAGDLRVDVAQARAETYPTPGALPEVRPATIAEDLARRDFTINAMAYPLTGDAELIDPHGGLADLQSGVLRVLHEGSFIDDPTRALRGARYAARFGLELEPETERLLRAADLDTVSQERVENELARTAAERDPAAALRRILDWGVMPSLDPQAPERVAEVTRLAEAVPWETWANRNRAVLLSIVRPLPQIRELAAATPERPSEAARLADPWDPDLLLVARALGAEWLDRYADEWRHVKLEISGEDLIEAGVPEGPAIGHGLNAALSGKLDGELSGRDQELGMALAAARGELPED
jgi:tRNA nucleotidyltransferase (CCA-adding enzyme)